MDIKTINKAWSVLPREFKYYVKCCYSEIKKALEKTGDSIYLNKLNLLECIFGEENLVSNGDEEDMLYVNKNKVQEVWQNVLERESGYSKMEQNSTIREELYFCRGEITMLDFLFGCDCLIDKKKCNEVQYHLEFNIGDKVVFHPFKSDSFYNAEVLEIRENEDKPYLLHVEDAENLWAYPIEVQSIAETYNEKIN